MKRFAAPGLTVVLSFLMVGAGCGQFEAAPENVEARLETVTLLKWKEVDDAIRYIIELDGEKLVRTQRDPAIHVSHQGPFEDIVIRAEGVGSAELGQTELLEARPAERLVIDWDPDVYETPYLGFRAGGSRVAKELSDRPHIIQFDADELDLLLFGEAVDDPDRIVNSPFELERHTVTEHGPYVELPLP